MFDETNKTEEQDFELPEKLFESSENEMTDPAESVGDTDANQSEGEENIGETLKIKYNGEERDITLDEARILAQKGMNYDHVVSERDTKYMRELQFLDKVAAERGMTRSQYMNAMENSPVGKETTNNAQGNMQNNSMAERAKAQIRRISDSVGFSGPWSNLFKRYPELSRDNAYAELSEDVKKGMSPLEAYQSKLIDERDRELRIARNNNNVAAKSIGSLEGERTGRNHDDFLEGFCIED